jgi:hypothetical protein
VAKKKETAFGGELSYRELAEIGHKIGSTADAKQISIHLNKMKGDETIEVQRSAAIIANASDINTEIFRDFISDLIQILKINAHRSAPRIAFRILEKIQDIPEAHLGELVDLSFKYLNKSSTSIAEKVFAMTVIANQIEHYPDLKYELEASLSAQVKTGSAGFRNRAGKIAAKYGLKL